MKVMTCLLLLLACSAVDAQIQGPRVNAGLRVLDEVGRPVVNANVSIWFNAMATSNVFDGTKTESVWGRSDRNGEFSVIHTALGEFGVGVQEEGFYVSRTRVRLDKHNDDKWEPFKHLIEVRLRKVESPIPMYARRLDYLEMPTTNSPVGYDLMAGDWVAPHGNGTAQDLVFTLQREFKGRYDFSWQLSVEFAGVGNGWQAISPTDETPESELRFPRFAPAHGYSFNNILLAFSRGSYGRMETNSATATNYFFQVRSEYDSNRQLKSAHYGKLLGPIQVNMLDTKTAKLSFVYYLNPTPLDRNMEFDRKRNLFNNLTSMERVQAP